MLGLHCYTGAFSSCDKWAAVQCRAGPFPAEAPPAAELGPRACRLQRLWPAGAHWLRCKCLACPKHLGSSQSRDQTRVACVASWTLHPWTTREAQQLVLKPLSFQTHLFRSGDRYPSSLVTRFRRHQCADAGGWHHSQPAAVNRQSERPLQRVRASGPPWVHVQMEDPGRSVGCR